MINENIKIELPLRYNKDNQTIYDNESKIMKFTFIESWKWDNPNFEHKMAQQIVDCLNKYLQDSEIFEREVMIQNDNENEVKFLESKTPVIYIDLEMTKEMD